MANKKFTSKSIPDVFYEVVGEGWMDDKTYIIVFQEMTDADGDVYHLEVEYHKDENEVFFVRVYEYDTLSGREYVSPCFVKQIEEYILHQVGVVKGMLAKQKIGIELTLDIDPSVTVAELEEWLKELTIGVTAMGDKIVPIKVDNLGYVR